MIDKSAAQAMIFIVVVMACLVSFMVVGAHYTVDSSPVCASTGGATGDSK